MALKIHELSPDAQGNIQARGLFDGRPFRMICDGARWLMRTDEHEVAEMAVPAAEPRSRTEAQGALWSIVARVREMQKLRTLSAA